MTTEPPIACTPDAAEMPARRAEMAAIARDLVSADVDELVAALASPLSATRGPRPA
jgi:hypothetical protein